MTNKEKYIEFCKKEPIPIYSQCWWLDAVAGDDNWDVLLFEKGGEIWASMPIYTKQKNIFTSITMPKLTKNMGVYIKYPENQKYYKKLSWEKEIMKYFIERLPKFDMFNVNFHYDIQNWLPFHWNGFNSSVLCSYIIEDTKDTDLIWKNFATKIRTEIKKAKKRVDIFEEDNIDNLYKLVEMTYKRQNLNPSYTIDFLRKLDSTCKKHNARKVLVAKDENDNIHSAAYFVWDSRSVYLIITGGDPKLRSSGANNLLIWEGINFASQKGLSFDFEGSMVKNIENYYYAFGAKQTIFFNISKINSKILKFIKG